MNGLELTRAFFFEVARDHLRTHLGDHFDRLAIGSVGEGSDRLGFDDDISQDHDWGVRLCIFVTEDDLVEFGDQLEEAVATFPREFRGCPVSRAEDERELRAGVVSINNFYERYAGFPHGPQTTREWRSVPEWSLAIAVSGEIFEDRLGEFTRIRSELERGYPEPLKRELLGKRVMELSQAGQYNFVRAVIREDRASALLSLSRFMENLFSALHILHDSYCPYYKWAGRSARELSQETSAIVKEAYGLLEVGSLLELTEVYDVKDRIESICTLFSDELVRRGYIEAPCDFLCDCVPEIFAMR